MVNFVQIFHVVMLMRNVAARSEAFNFASKSIGTRKRQNIIKTINNAQFLWYDYNTSLFVDNHTVLQHEQKLYMYYGTVLYCMCGIDKDTNKRGQLGIVLYLLYCMYCTVCRKQLNSQVIPKLSASANFSMLPIC